MQIIKKYQDLVLATSHNYREGEYLLIDEDIYPVPGTIEEMEELLEEFDYTYIYYCINWEDHNMFDSSGNRIPAVY